jgi:L-ascorbate metabolism protein UlaG (beta-lactamase superfamily)
MQPTIRLTKHAHACVTLTRDEGRIVIDPGAFTPDAADAVAAAEVVLITHEHFDHFDEELIAKALEVRPELRVYGPQSVVGRWEARRGQVTAVVAGDRFTAAGFDVAVFGELHAPIHRDIPRVANVGYLLDERVYHPGDSYQAPAASVDTLLLPTSGPWTKVGEAADFMNEVAPRKAIQIHEVMLSEVGQQSMTRFLGPDMLTTTPLEIIPIGDTVEV